MHAFESSADCPGPAARPATRPATRPCSQLLRALRAVPAAVCAAAIIRDPRSAGLQSLSDEQLKDIGISRCQIWYMAHGTSASSTRNGHAED